MSLKLFPKNQKVVAVKKELDKRKIRLISDHKGGAIAVKAPIHFTRQAS